MREVQLKLCGGAEMTVHAKPVFTVKVYVKEQSWIRIEYSSDETDVSVDLFGSIWLTMQPYEVLWQVFNNILLKEGSRCG